MPHGRSGCSPCHAGARGKHPIRRVTLDLVLAVCRRLEAESTVEPVFGRVGACKRANGFLTELCRVARRALRSCSGIGGNSGRRTGVDGQCSNLRALYHIAIKSCGGLEHTGGRPGHGGHPASQSGRRRENRASCARPGMVSRWKRRRGRVCVRRLAGNQNPGTRPVPSSGAMRRMAVRISNYRCAGLPVSNESGPSTFLTLT